MASGTTNTKPFIYIFSNPSRLKSHKKNMFKRYVITYTKTNLKISLLSLLPNTRLPIVLKLNNTPSIVENNTARG